MEEVLKYSQSIYSGTRRVNFLISRAQLMILEKHHNRGVLPEDYILVGDVGGAESEEFRKAREIYKRLRESSQNERDEMEVGAVKARDIKLSLLETAEIDEVLTAISELKRTTKALQEFIG